MDSLETADEMKRGKGMMVLESPLIISFRFALCSLRVIRIVIKKSELYYNPKLQKLTESAVCDTEEVNLTAGIQLTEFFSLNSEAWSDAAKQLQGLTFRTARCSMAFGTARCS